MYSHGTIYKQRIEQSIRHVSAHNCISFSFKILQTEVKKSSTICERCLCIKCAKDYFMYLCIFFKNLAGLFMKC